jgi:hypothetical protein|tara:strand:- start:1172 stop:1417 length:246 start_codon:yes stop_codon:yes gene_type:complete
MNEFPEDQFDDEMSDEGFYQLSMGIDDIYLMYHCVQETIKNWPGSPARPYEEQQHLWDLRDNLYRCILDHKFHFMDTDRPE